MFVVKVCRLDLTTNFHHEPGGALRDNIKNGCGCVTVYQSLGSDGINRGRVQNEDNISDVVFFKRDIKERHKTYLYRFIL